MSKCESNVQTPKDENNGLEGTLLEFRSEQNLIGKDGKNRNGHSHGWRKDMGPLHRPNEKGRGPKPHNHPAYVSLVLEVQQVKFPQCQQNSRADQHKQGDRRHVQDKDVKTGSKDESWVDPSVIQPGMGVPFIGGGGFGRLVT